MGEVTIKDILDEVQEIKPNTLSEALAIKYLSRLDLQLWEELLSWHDGIDDFYTHMFDVDAEGNETSKLPYSAKTNTLLVPYEYAALYVDYLVMKIDLINNDLQRYNNSAINFSAMLDSFASFINRNYMPSKAYRVGINSASNLTYRQMLKKVMQNDREMSEIEALLGGI